MTCPKCGSENTYTVDSRDGRDGRRRRKRCQDCDNRWTTIEISVEKYQRLKRLHDVLRDVMSCLTCRQLEEYEYSSVPDEGYGLIGIYGWHISDLVIYDKPKELSEFEGLQKTRFGYAPYKITRPPQSWCYVEDV